MAKKKWHDYGNDETEKAIEELEKRIAKEYRKAATDINAKWTEYLYQFNKGWSEQQKLFDDGKITEKELQDWKFRHIQMGKRWEEMSDTLAEDMYNASQIAKKLTNEALPDVYAINHNFATYDIMANGHVDFSYTLYDHKTVERILKDNPDLFHEPGKKVSEDIKHGKAIRWNKQQMNSAITQSILQGEDITKAAERLEAVTERGFDAAVRNARTAITGAQNAGRIDSYHEAEEMGIEVQKMWIATLDNRTRHEHRMLDGVSVPVDDPFVVEGEEIMYPGDPTASPGMVYNCRCTMRSVIKGFEGRHVTESPKMGGMSYDDWKTAMKDKGKKGKDNG